MADSTRLKTTEDLARKNDARLNEMVEQFKSMENEFKHKGNNSQIKRPIRLPSNKGWRTDLMSYSKY